MKALTKEVCNYGFGVQVYRQLSVAITDRHLVQLKNPFNRFDDRSAVADIDVAFAWQSGHRPLQRGTTYGIDGAFPDSLQPALLRVYQWTSAEWHRFLNDTSEKGSGCDPPTMQARPSKGKNPEKRERQFQGLLSPPKRLCQTNDGSPNVYEAAAARMPASHELALDVHAAATSSEHGDVDENGIYHLLSHHRVSRLAQSSKGSLDRIRAPGVPSSERKIDVIRHKNNASSQWEAASRLLNIRPKNNSDVCSEDSDTLDLVYSNRRRRNYHNSFVFR